MSENVLVVNDSGLYCAAGDFYIDPWRPVERAVITHAHSDHARFGSTKYLTAKHGIGLLRVRLGDIDVSGLDWNEPVQIGTAKVSLHSAGHILGSAQVRVEVNGEVWVVSGDYKRAADPTCTPFEPQKCHTFVTESTFGLPIYRWPDQGEMFHELNRWWKQNRDAGLATVICAYSLGKAQRILSGLEPGIGAIFTHGAVERMNTEYRAQNVPLPETKSVFSVPTKSQFAGAMVIAPPSAVGSPWLRRFGEYRLGVASGWMQIRGTRRRRGVDRGFVISDHADWPALLATIQETGASRILATHGYTGAIVRWLREQGLQADALHTAFEGEKMEGDPDAIDVESPAEGSVNS